MFLSLSLYLRILFARIFQNVDAERNAQCSFINYKKKWRTWPEWVIPSSPCGSCLCRTRSWPNPVRMRSFRRCANPEKSFRAVRREKFTWIAAFGRLTLMKNDFARCAPKKVDSKWALLCLILNIRSWNLLSMSEVSSLIADLPRSNSFYVS